MREWRRCTFLHSVESSPALHRNQQILYVSRLKRRSPCDRVGFKPTADSGFALLVFLHGPGSGAACLLRNLTTKPYKNDFRLLPKELDAAEKVATLHLIALGSVRTLFSQEHADYLGVKVEGPFKVGHYRF